MDLLTQALNARDAAVAVLQMQCTAAMNQEAALKIQASVDAAERLKLAEQILAWSAAFVKIDVYSRLAAFNPNGLVIFEPDIPGRLIEASATGASSISINGAGALIYRGAIDSYVRCARANVVRATPSAPLNTAAAIADFFHVQYLRALSVHITSDTVYKLLASRVRI